MAYNLLCFYLYVAILEIHLYVLYLDGPQFCKKNPSEMKENYLFMSTQNAHELVHLFDADTIENRKKSCSFSRPSKRVDHVGIFPTWSDAYMVGCAQTILRIFLVALRRPYLGWPLTSHYNCYNLLQISHVAFPFFSF